MLRQLSVPDIIPAMVLRDVVFFPQSILPLYIFENRYRQMLEDVIEGHRMFTIINKLPGSLDEYDRENREEIVTLGYIKACQTHPDGTSMLLLEGICRLTVQEYFSDQPYPTLKVIPTPEPQNDPDILESLRLETLELLEKIQVKGGEISEEAIFHLRQVHTPQHFVDHAAVSYLKSTVETQSILKCSDPVQRYSKLLKHLNRSYQQIELIDAMIGPLIPSEIGRN